MSVRSEAGLNLVVGCGSGSAGDYIQTLVLGSGHEDIFPLAAEGAI